MSVSPKYFFFVGWFFLLYLIPLLIFMKGLLLHRDVLANNSFCIKDTFSTCYSQTSSDALEDCFQFYNHSSIDGQYCGSSNFKVILVIIDALRYDFTDFEKASLSNVPPYLNKLLMIKDLLETRPQHSRLFKFVADPPTTTMQRIKGLTTGSLPTFIEVGSNFFSGQIDENNIIDVIKEEGKNVVFLGDDTWCKLYPNRFLRQFPFDSFNVWDLDSVDYGIREHLISQIRTPDWHLLIAHFLGVDHCGHRYGPNHPEMTRKLTEMNNVLKEIIDEINSSEDVLLFVIGDHGMTTTGDHGGDTENEITSALFTYSPIHPFYSNHTRAGQSVSQVDLVPTLASVLGVSIPFSNTGRLVLESIPSTLTQSATQVAFLLRQNIEQLTNYVKQYSLRNVELNVSGEMDVILDQYNKLKEIWNENKDLLKFTHEYDLYMRSVLEKFRKLWIQFNMAYIAIGILLVVLALGLCVIIISVLTIEEQKQFCFNSYSFAQVIVSSAVMLSLSGQFVSGDTMLIGYMLLEVLSIVKLIHLCLPVLRMKLLYQRLPKMRMIDILILFTVFCSTIALFSNSFIIEEPSVALFFVMTCIWASLILSEKKLSNNLVDFIKSPTLRICIIISIFLKAGSYSVRCREEQRDCRFADEEKNALIYCGLILVVLLWYSIQVKDRGASMWRVRTLCVVTLFVYQLSETVFGISKMHVLVDKIPATLFMISLAMICYILLNPMGSRVDVCIWRKDLFESRFNLAWINFSTYMCIIFCILLGEKLTVVAVFMFLGLPCLAVFLDLVTVKSSISDYNVRWSHVIIWGTSSIYWFYATGHNALFSSIQWNAAFLFQKDIGNNMLVPSVLVGMNTFASYIVHGFLMTYLLTPCRQNSVMDPLEKEKLHFHSFLLFLKYVTFFAIRLLVMMLSCTLHSRHLMIWMIFAPKFIFEGLAFVISSACSIMGLVFACRLRTH